jgi:hypothetical protein
MRLLGVIKSLPSITSRIGVGGAASSWVTKEFIAQIHTVSKVAVHRKSNLASFLETHGINFTPTFVEEKSHDFLYLNHEILTLFMHSS